MKKILLMLFIVSVALGFAQDTLYLGLTSEPTYELGFRYYYVDSFTVHVEDGIYKLTFPRPLYNTTVTALNAATDSGWCYVYTDIFRSIVHNDTLSRTLWSFTVGDNSDDDILHIYDRLNVLYFNPQVAGATNADSTAKYKVEGWAY